MGMTVQCTLALYWENLKICRRGMGCIGLVTKHFFFLEHPVHCTYTYIWQSDRQTETGRQLYNYKVILQPKLEWQGEKGGKGGKDWKQKGGKWYLGRGDSVFLDVSFLPLPKCPAVTLAELSAFFVHLTHRHRNNYYRYIYYNHYYNYHITIIYLW